MNSLAKKEYISLGILAVLLLVSIIPSLRYARAEKRDGARRDNLAELKHQLEEKNNKLGYYPLEFPSGTNSYIVTSQQGKMATGWYVQTTLENSHSPISGFDFEGDHNFYYRISQKNGITYYDICGGEDTCGAEPINQ